MKKYFVTFSDKNFKQARDRITNEARQLGYFDGVISYGPEVLSNELKQTGLLNIKRGYGYWSWKPDVIMKAFDSMEEGDLLVYVDSGSYLYKDKEWDLFFKSLQYHDIILFNIQNRVVSWTKKSVLNFFEYSSKKFLMKKYLVAGGIIFLKKNKETIDFINKWRRIMIEHPDLLYDISTEEENEQLDSFIEHRHDQAILTQVAYTSKKIKINFRWENFESRSWYGQAIYAARSNSSKQIIVKGKIFKYTIRHFVIYPVIGLFMMNKDQN